MGEDRAVPLAGLPPPLRHQAPLLLATLHPLRPPYGGHESGDSIPDPTAQPGGGTSICSQCTRAGRGWRIPHPLEAVLDGIYERGEHGHPEPTPSCTSCELIDAAIRHAFATYKETDT